MDVIQSVVWKVVQEAVSLIRAGVDTPSEAGPRQLRARRMYYCEKYNICKFETVVNTVRYTRRASVCTGGMFITQAQIYAQIQAWNTWNLADAQRESHGSQRITEPRRVLQNCTTQWMADSQSLHDNHRDPQRLTETLRVSQDNHTHKVSL